METDRRIVDISDYWINIIRDTAEFKQIAAAENPEFNDLLGCIYRIVADAFIKESTEYGVSKWESILNLPVDEGLTLDERKAKILTYLSVNRPYTWRILKQMLVQILGGEDKFVMEYINDEGKLVLHTDALTDEMMQTINELLERVIPQNIEVVRYNHSIDIPWRDWQVGYTQLSFLESHGTHEYIDTGHKFTNNSRIEVIGTPIADQGWVCSFYNSGFNSSASPSHGYWWDFNNTERPVYVYGTSSIWGEKGFNLGVKRHVVQDANKFYLDGNLMVTFEETEPFEDTKVCFLFRANSPSTPAWPTYQRIYMFRAETDGVKQCDYIPAIDSTGEPCMYDTTTKQPFYTPTGSFIAGIETLAQLQNMAHNLPNSSETITLSLPDTFQTDTAAQAALEKARSKGWTVKIHEWRITDPNATQTTDLLDEPTIFVKAQESEYGEYVNADGTRIHLETCVAIYHPEGKTPEELGYTPYLSLDEAKSELGLTEYIEEELENE